GIAFSALLFIFRESLFTIKDPFLYISWWSFVTGIVITVFVSLLSAAPQIQRLRGFVYEMSRKDVV
ncbi:MAG: hypothetical protein ACE5I1_26765, partial [bacterium]